MSLLGKKIDINNKIIKIMIVKIHVITDNKFNLLLKLSINDLIFLVIEFVNLSFKSFLNKVVSSSILLIYTVENFFIK